jgi:2-polyprenyl-6-methoxyphenol hydroxylase-like FAD-dependent oxidoreductase
MKVLIIGGGVGGLTAAVALAQGGHRVQVLERAERFPRPGPALRLAPNATAVLHRLGLLDHVLDLGTQPLRAVLRDLRSDAELATLDLGAPLLARYGTPYVVIGRADLLSLLADGCADADVDLRPGREVTAIDQSPLASAVMGGTLVTCADGQVQTGDAVIAADGAVSVARSLLGAGVPSGDRWAGYRSSAARGDLGARAADADDEVVAWMGPDAHFTRFPIRAGEAYEQVAVFRSGPGSGPGGGSGSGSGGGAGAWGGPDELDAAFAGAAPGVRAAVALLRRDHCWRMLDRAPLPAWVSDRVALLGDAVHPMPAYLAQGACQALEDAAALADALSACADPGGVAEALRAYQERRAPRASRVQRARQVWDAGTDWLYAPS